MKKIAIYLLGFLALTFLTFLILYQEKSPQEEKKESSPAPLPEEQDHAEEKIVKLSEDQIKEMGLTFKTAQPGKMQFTLSTRGKITLDPDRFAHIIPKISGIAKEARKNIGNDVKTGEILAILESQEMADLQAAYLAALNKEKFAASVLKREEKLYQKRISPAQDFFNAQHAYAEAHLHVQLATQKLQALGLNDEEMGRLVEYSHLNLGLYPIYAPLDGTVMMRHITQGEWIDNSATLYEIADLSHVWVEIGIYPKDLDRIREGQSVEIVHADLPQTAQARLIYVSPLITQDTLTSKAIALLDNRQRIWRPGSFVKVEIATDQISSPLVISKEAIQKVEGCDCAFIATPQGFEKRILTLGRSDHQHVEVLAGLLPGERYVASHPFLLKAEMNKESARDD